MKKCGITFNPLLLKVLQEELRKKYKHPAIELMDIYQNINILCGDEWVHAQRGFMLGMANNCVTIIQIAVLALVRKFSDVDCKILTGNDDMVVAFDECVSIEDVALFRYTDE